MDYGRLVFPETRWLLQPFLMPGILTSGGTTETYYEMDPVTATDYNLGASSGSSSASLQIVGTGVALA